MCIICVSSTVYSCQIWGSFTIIYPPARSCQHLQACTLLIVSTRVNDAAAVCECVHVCPLLAHSDRQSASGCFLRHPTQRELPRSSSSQFKSTLDVILPGHSTQQKPRVELLPVCSPLSLVHHAVKSLVVNDGVRDDRGENREGRGSR